MTDERTDDRIENVKNPNLNIYGFIYKNYKDILAVLIFVFCVLILVFNDKALGSEKISTVLVSAISGSLGFIFGKKIS
ncbi:MAG: hypothetical protein ACEPO8_14620 [Rhodothermaceae bacterium]